MTTVLRREHGVTVILNGSDEYLLDTADEGRVGGLSDLQQDRNGYLYRREGRRIVYLHHMVLPPRRGKLTDHANGDIRDNRRENLRNASPSQNQWNRRVVQGRVPFKGVCVHKATGKYQAQIKRRGRSIYLGLHAKPEDAAAAYWTAAQKIAGAFAWSNYQPRPEREGQAA